MVNDTRTLTVERSTSTAHRLAHYDGVCGNVHGHNMEWDVTLEVAMDGTGEDNMPLDFKRVSDIIDRYDHACLLNEQDAVDLGQSLNEWLDDGVLPRDAAEVIEQFFGEVYWFDGDPTCELIAQVVADRLVEVGPVMSAEVTLYETAKYGMSADSKASVVSQADDV